MAFMSDFNIGNLTLGKTSSAVSSTSSSSSFGGGAVASSVISAIGDIATGFINASKAQNAYKYNAAMSELSKRMYRLSAKKEINRIRGEGVSILSTQRAAIAKSGLALSGSPLEVMRQSQEDAELDLIYAQINLDYGSSLYDTQTGLQNLYANRSVYSGWQNTYKSILNLASVKLKQG